MNAAPQAIPATRATNQTLGAAEIVEWTGRGNLEETWDAERWILGAQGLNGLILGR